MKTPPLILLLLVFTVTTAFGQANGVWSTTNGGNGHYYEVVSSASSINWSTAQSAATDRGGYLATITSQAENAFLTNLAPIPAWIGGFQTQNSIEPSGGWKWVTGEPFTYTNWANLEPNNQAHPPFTTDENRIQITASGTWNDIPDNLSGFTEMYSYVIEYNAPPPRLFGISIGQNDFIGVHGGKGATAVFNRLSQQSTWVTNSSQGNTTQPIIFETANIDSQESVLSSLDAMQVRPGDTLVFYYNGHGGTGQIHDEPADERAIIVEGNADQHDEYLDVGFSDDDLVFIFSDPKWQGVRKIFLLDACHSGGFFGGDDFGDLEKLDNVALFAAAPEDKNTYSVFYSIDDFGMGIWTREALLPALDANGLNFDALADALAQNSALAFAQFEGAEAYILGSPGDVATIDSLTTISGHSSDFNTLKSVIPVPESTSALNMFKLSNDMAPDGSQDLLSFANDGVPNIYKYAFNMIGSGSGQAISLYIPNTQSVGAAGTAGLPFSEYQLNGEAQLKWTYVRRKASTSPGITYLVEFCDDLATGPWGTNPSASESTEDIDVNFERVTVTDSVIGAAKRFSRVRVTVP
jgi:hypothetical protein